MTDAPSLASAMGAMNISDQARSRSTDGSSSERKKLGYTAERVIGNGSFGVVYQATVTGGRETVAIKKVLQDRRFKNRELEIMQQLKHPSVVDLKHHFYSRGNNRDEIYLNLVMSFVPENLHYAIRTHAKARRLIPYLYSKVYIYQIARSLAYIHSLGVCHRDIKPQNLLYCPTRHFVKLCDFGSAKTLVRGSANVAYICSRYYRAPELVFEATEYTTAIDTWSMGCVFAEMLLGEPLFPGESAVDQMMQIINLLGTPGKPELKAMNPDHVPVRLPETKATPWETKIPRAPAGALDLLSKILRYDPSKRLDPFACLAHPYFDELRQEGTQLANSTRLPELFNFTPEELKMMHERNITDKVIPEYQRAKFGLPAQLGNNVAPTYPTGGYGPSS